MCFLAYIPPEKICSRCGIPQSWDNFSSDRTKPNGMDYLCRKCDSIKQRAGYQRNQSHKIAYDRQWKLANRPRILIQRRARYAKNPEKYRAAAREDRKHHPEKFKLRGQQQREKHRPTLLLACRKYTELHKKERQAWWRSHRILACLYAAKRRARTRNLPDTFTLDERNFMLSYWGHACVICGNQAGFWHTLADDHWIPVNATTCPGTVAENMIPLCHGINGCNNSKRDHDPVVWLLTRFSRTQTKRILAKIDAYFAIVRARRLESETG